MNANVKKLLEFDEDVQAVARWYLTENPMRLRMAMAAGGLDSVIHETWLTLSMGQHRLEKQTVKWTTLLVNQLRWTLLGMVKQLNEQNQLIEFDPPPHPEPGMTPNPTKRLEQEELVKAVQWAICQIDDPKHFAVAQMFFIADKSVTQSARSLNLSPRYVSVLAKRSLRRLQQLDIARELVGHL